MKHKQHEDRYEDVTLGHILHVLREHTKILENIAAILSGNSTGAPAKSLAMTLGTAEQK